MKAVAPAKPIFTYRQISVELEGVDLSTIGGLMVTADDKGNPIKAGRLELAGGESSVILLTSPLHPC